MHAHHFAQLYLRKAPRASIAKSFMLTIAISNTIIQMETQTNTDMYVETQTNTDEKKQIRKKNVQTRKLFTPEA